MKINVICNISKSCNLWEIKRDKIEFVSVKGLNKYLV